MGPADIASMDHATMEAIWSAEGSETRAPLAEGPDGLAIASFGNHIYRSAVPNLMLQDVPPPTMASKPRASAPKAPLRFVRVLKRPAAFKRPAAARSKAIPVPHTAGSIEDCVPPSFDFLLWVFCSPWRKG